MFKNTLKVEMTGEQLYVLLDDLVYEDDEIEVVVVKGFDFDGFSAPKLVWSLFGAPLSGKTALGAVVHDAGYSSQIYDRIWYDALFDRVNRAQEVSAVKRWVIYWTARLLGGYRWRLAQEFKDEYKNCIKVRFKNEVQ